MAEEPGEFVASTPSYPTQLLPFMGRAERFFGPQFTTPRVAHRSQEFVDFSQWFGLLLGQAAVANEDLDHRIFIVEFESQLIDTYLSNGSQEPKLTGSVAGKIVDRCKKLFEACFRVHVQRPESRCISP